MELKLFRVRFMEKRTVGQLYVNGEFFCFTEEDTMREVEGEPVEKWKVMAETAIPQGRYEIQLQVSGRFGPETPTLVNVPGFKYIRIHPGNTEKDTEGCLLLGYSLMEDGTLKGGTSRPAVRDFKEILRKTKEQVYITITNINTR